MVAQSSDHCKPTLTCILAVTVRPTLACVLAVRLAGERRDRPLLVSAKKHDQWVRGCRKQGQPTLCSLLLASLVFLAVVVEQWGA